MIYTNMKQLHGVSTNNDVTSEKGNIHVPANLDNNELISSNRDVTNENGDPTKPGPIKKAKMVNGNHGNGATLPAIGGDPACM